MTVVQLKMTSVADKTVSDRVLKVDPVNPERTDFEKAASILRAGQLVVAPSETRYALIARADSDTSVAQLIAAKGRGHSSPISIFVTEEGEIERELELSDAARRLVAEFLPGPLTLVGRARRHWPRAISPDGSLGVRLSPSPIINGLLRATSFPLTATSANRSGEPDLEDIPAILDSLGKSVALYLDGGVLTGPTSTVVMCVGAGIKVIREGAIPAGQIERIALGRSR